MRGKAVLAVGAGLVYLFGTESGRRHVEKAKAWASSTWENPTVQKTVHDVEERVTQVIKEQSAQLGEKLSTAIKDATGGAKVQDAPADPDEIVVEEDGSVRQPGHRA